MEITPNQIALLNIFGNNEIENIFFRLTETPNIPNEDYIFFKASGVCRSPVGKKPNKKEHSFRAGGCQSFGQVVHELMHMIGKY